MDIKTALKRPFTDLKGLVLGIILYAIPIINFFSLGYILESLKLSINKKDEMPEWKNWGFLFVNGFFMFLLQLIYFIPLLIIALIAVYSIGFAKLTSYVTKEYVFKITNEQALLLIKEIWPLAVIGILILILISYIIPSVILSFVKNYKFKEAFNFKEIFKKAFTINYLFVFIIGSLIQYILIFILSFIPFIGSSIGGFIGYIIFFTLLAQISSKGGLKNGKKTKR